jgi:hypothetical protein
MIQLAKSPSDETYSPPRIDKSILPPRIIAKLWDDEKKDAPFTIVTVCLFALIKSASSSSSRGALLPIPRIPFSD